jgi:hypothetical protein
VGTGLQPVSERLRIAAVSIKLSSWGCKPRPARESMPLSFRGFCLSLKNRNLERIYRFIFNFEVLVFLRKTKTSKRYIVGWVRFFSEAT